MFEIISGLASSILTNEIYEKLSEISPEKPVIKMAETPNINCFQWHIRLVNPSKCRSLLSKADKR